MIVELSKVKVEIKDQLTWGDVEKINGAQMKGAKLNGSANDPNKLDFDFDTSALTEAKYVALECAVISIDEDGKKSDFSRDFMNNLSLSDGNSLYGEVEKLTKKEVGTTSN